MHSRMHSPVKSVGKLSSVRRTLVVMLLHHSHAKCSAACKVLPKASCRSVVISICHMGATSQRQIFW